MWNGPDEPYQELPDPPSTPEIENSRILRAIIPARAALAALNQSCRQLPGPSLLINIIPILETQASNEIENIVTTQDELFRATNSAETTTTTPAAREALRYHQALRRYAHPLQRL